mmetsp:Transcript_66139/g.215196  ORF Transcript_66139/g.215196 Transcript_66139/m.215196 type:complete len:339 (+) Transcript_66139:204-1220(+)
MCESIPAHLFTQLPSAFGAAVYKRRTRKQKPWGLYHHAWWSLLVVPAEQVLEKGLGDVPELVLLFACEALHCIAPALHRLVGDVPEFVVLLAREGRDRTLGARVDLFRDVPELILLFAGELRNRGLARQRHLPGDVLEVDVVQGGDGALPPLRHLRIHVVEVVVLFANEAPQRVRHSGLHGIAGIRRTLLHGNALRGLRQHQQPREVPHPVWVVRSLGNSDLLLEIRLKLHQLGAAVAADDLGLDGTQRDRCRAPARPDAPCGRQRLGGPREPREGPAAQCSERCQARGQEERRATSAEARSLHGASRRARHRGRAGGRRASKWARLKGTVRAAQPTF